MLISLRTLINTTLFRIIVLVGFWTYTKLFDQEPAKYLLHMIGWDKLGNITVVQESNSSREDLSSRLENIERWTKSTHNICLVQSLDS